MPGPRAKSKRASTSAGSSRKSSRQLDHEIAAALQHHVPRETARAHEQEQEDWLEDQIRQAALRIAGGFDRRVRLMGWEQRRVCLDGTLHVTAYVKGGPDQCAALLDVEHDRLGRCTIMRLAT
jgi:hypothetical protein